MTTISKYEGQFIGSEERFPSPFGTVEDAAIHLARLHGGSSAPGRRNRAERVVHGTGDIVRVYLTGRKGAVTMRIRSVEA